MRVRQTSRIAQVVRSIGKGLGCSLSVIPYDFARMVEEAPIKPAITKLIL